VEFEFTFQDGDSPADLELAVSGVPSAEGSLPLNGRRTADLRFRSGLRMLGT
jgi:hypothetical protein